MEFISKGLVYRVKAVQQLPMTVKEAWDFFSNPRNLAKITPDSLNFRILSGADSSIYAGQIIQYKVSPLPFYTTTWVTEITHVENEKLFVDKQLYGPYAMWHHQHYFKAIPGGVEVSDVVDFKVPLGWFGRILSKGLIKGEILKIFSHRNEALTALFGQIKS